MSLRFEEMERKRSQTAGEPCLHAAISTGHVSRPSADVKAPKQRSATSKSVAGGLRSAFGQLSELLSAPVSHLTN